MFCLLAIVLALVAEAAVIESSYVCDDCKSKVRVQVRGSGQDIFMDIARIKCKASCKEGAAPFKQVKCPRLCGSGHPSPPNCFLCYPDTYKFISRCRSAMNYMVLRCQEGFATAAPEVAEEKKRIRSTSRTLRMTLPVRFSPLKL